MVRLANCREVSWQPNPHLKGNGKPYSQDPLMLNQAYHRGHDIKLAHIYAVMNITRFECLRAVMTKTSTTSSAPIATSVPRTNHRWTAKPDSVTVYAKPTFCQSLENRNGAKGMIQA